MKKILLLFLLVLAGSAFSQSDSLKYAQLDSLSPEQLQEYYINEPEPIQFYKGPDVGDSVYYTLSPAVVPTQTVEADPLTLNRERPESALNPNELDTTSLVEQQLKPKISLGSGRLSYHGDLYKKHFQIPQTARLAFDLGISQRLTRYLQLDFSVLFGKLGANEWLNNRQENFQSEIRAGGVNLLYDFGNFIPDRYSIRPYVSFGVMGFEFLSKTDLRDRNGNLYYYWSDGSIKNMAEGTAGAQNAQDLIRDYKYESDIRELNKDGFGKYQERAWSFPIGFGFVMKITDRVDAKLNFQYFFSTTDYIDGVSEKSLGNRVGTKQQDNFAYMSVSLQYDLIAKLKPRKKVAADTLNNAFWLALEKEDKDNDGVTDLSDDCLGTAEGAKVDLKGCPLDEDGDGIPNYRDDELTTPPGVPVNARGVAQNDEYWQNWYANYLNDTTDLVRETEVIGNMFAAAPVEKKKKKKNKSDDVYTVELVRYNGSIPSDELAFLLSIGDINTATLDDGTTVVYTSTTYDKLASAIKRRDEFRSIGNKSAIVSRMKGKNFIPILDDELEQLLKNEAEDMKNGSDSTSTGPEEVVESFGKNDIVYRVQLGAFKNRISTSVFNTSAGSVLELQTGESIYRYVTKGYKTIEQAAEVRADLVIQGYSDAFVTAYKDGHRIPLNQTGTTVDKEFKEDLNENKMFSSINKNLVAFKIQLGPLRKKSMEEMMDEKFKELSQVEKEVTLSGSIRYTSGGSFPSMDAAEKYRKELEDKGFFDALVIATFKNQVISLQEAAELLK
jgi:hypothetical protein